MIGRFRMASESHFCGQDLLGKCKGDTAKEKSLKAFLSHSSSLVTQGNCVVQTLAGSSPKVTRASYGRFQGRQRQTALLVPVQFAAQTASRMLRKQVLGKLRPQRQRQQLQRQRMQRQERTRLRRLPRRRGQQAKDLGNFHDFQCWSTVVHGSPAT